MKAEEVRYMWIFVFFDLPVRTKPQRKAASQFRTFLKNDGFLMLQYSVYARICRGQDAVDKHRRRVQQHLPAKGSVRVLQVTDKQYGRMELLLGNATKTEESAPVQLLLL